MIFFIPCFSLILLSLSLSLFSRPPLFSVLRGPPSLFSLVPSTFPFSFRRLLPRPRQAPPLAPPSPSAAAGPACSLFYLRVSSSKDLEEGWAVDAVVLYRGNIDDASIRRGLT
ncbi:hypothetical protein Salat_0678400 [Sesamum alatum]|uniref:Uncharacterized protein n=1 Tax=Sesamum alatum TaxID=300844 RepID=A0AAE1YSE7_9LAMI|nr:hypothetical protein Salat_0678400 [Sesamum alatum]